MRVSLVLLPLLALGACSSPAEVAEKTGTVHASSSVTHSSASASASSAAGGAVAVKEDNDLYSYAFAYPSAVGAQPKLAAQLQAAADKEKATLIAAAKTAQAEQKKAGYPYNPHSWSQEWKVVADTPGFLSLSGAFANYEGGAHGMYGLRSLVWDKQANRSLDAVELFTSPAALDGALGKRLCDALNAERAKRRGDTPQAEGPITDFDDCQHIKDATVLVGSSNAQAFDRIGVWFGPYVAGPYAEGAYELNFPVDAAVLRAVKPQYASAFAVKR